jgi:hypothetical protein
VTDEQLSRAVSAEVRRLLDERNMSGNQLAKASGLEQEPHELIEWARRS